MLIPAACLLAGCTDPRERLVPPEVRLSFASQSVTSPGTISGSLHVFDADGLDILLLSLRTSDSAIALDSVQGFAGQTELNRDLEFVVPSGRPAGSTIRVVARVTDQTGLQGADSTDFTLGIQLVSP